MKKNYIRKKFNSVKDSPYRQRILIFFKSFPYWVRRGSGFFIGVIALLFFIAAIFAGLIGSTKLLETLQSNIYLSNTANETNSSNSIIEIFINLAEYFMVSVTFFAISIGLAYFSIPESDEKGIQKWADISEFEKYMFGMVISTISLIFLSGIPSAMQMISNVSPNDIIGATDFILKTGVGIASVIVALGVYIYLSTR